MPSVGEVYTPLIEAAKTADPKGHELLKAAGRAIFEANRDKCPSEEDGVEAAKRNLDYFCQYFPEAVAAVTKSFYGLGAGFRNVGGGKHLFT